MGEPPVSSTQAPGLAAWWDEVSTCALVGTGRRPVPKPPHELVAALGVDHDGPGSTDVDVHVHPETRLLDQIAIGTAWLGGAVPSVAPESLEPAPDETLPLAPPMALQILELVLTEALAAPAATPALVADWAEAAFVHGVRVPPLLVPQLLDHAALGAGRGTPSAVQRETRAALLAVTGERGRWLAALDPRWQSLLTTNPPSSSPARHDLQTSDDHAPALPDDWAQLPLGDQIELLTRLRSHEPDAVREAVAEGCRSGSARERAAYLRVLADNLGSADEELLEHALADRAGGVREEAARLLARLPDSARAARMGERLRPLVSVTTRLFRRKVTVLLPDPPDPAGVRDGLGKPPRGRSVRGHHLTEIIAGAPLALWRELTGLEPEAILAGLDLSDDVIPGLRRAAAGQRDPVWARALIEHSGIHPALLDVLDPADAERFVTDRLRGANAQEGALVLERVPGPWGPALSEAAVDHLGR
ncbi:MAG: DUF5691 domain-containing protein, partial [Dermatophilaceae bacterium]